MQERYRFNRLELAGALGDLGTLLPIAIAMVMVNGLSPGGLFFTVGLFYVFAGVYFGVTVPVQPMKVIGAYAVAMGLSCAQIQASTLLVGILLLVIGVSGFMHVLKRYTPIAVIRGVQLATGVLLIVSGVKYMLGSSNFQLMAGAAEPQLITQHIGPVPIGLLFGVLCGIITLFFLHSKRFPGGLLVVVLGLVLGVLFGAANGLGIEMFGLHLPEFLPFAMPSEADFSFALLALVIPQLPMTLGNAVLAYSDLSHEYFGETSRRVTNQSVCLSMGLANIVSFCLGGMPLCHGAGGLAAHYRFGARTAGSNLIIGLFFIGLALLLGPEIIKILHLMPLSVLGVLLMFAGSQLALMIMTLEERKDYFTVMLMLGITLASNLAAGFLAGLVLSHVLRWKRLAV